MLMLSRWENPFQRINPRISGLDQTIVSIATPKMVCPQQDQVAWFAMEIKATLLAGCGYTQEQSSSVADEKCGSGGAINSLTFDPP
jgi:hypothetical protein